ncbi:MAG TPA: class I SAM-dependent methyltransferase [Bacteroidota bacterium]|nr:class I SAM-dependent methyltransferase [Bacteroidota bacterium]
MTGQGAYPDEGAAAGHAELAGDFHDAMAASYDRTFGRPGPGARIRARVQEALFAAFRPGERVLELNCGTGTDAVALALRGIRVTATDISPAMVAEARAKARRSGVEDLVSTAVMDAADPGAPDGRLFDGAFSNFDGLNELGNIAAFAGRIGGHLAPGAPLLCMVLNPVCLWEVAYFAATLRPRRALRRILARGEELAPLHAAAPLKLYSPGRFASYFRRDFTVAAVRRFGLLLPPAGFGRLYATRASLMRRLEPWDEGIARLFPLRYLCDHYLITLRRRGALR